jgi:hypothetical protein
MRSGKKRAEKKANNSRYFTGLFVYDQKPSSLKLKKTETVSVCSVHPKGATIRARGSGSLFLKSDFIRGNLQAYIMARAQTS